MTDQFSSTLEFLKHMVLKCKTKCQLKIVQELKIHESSANVEHTDK